MATNRDLRIDYMPLAELLAARWPRNPKRHDLPTLSKSLARFGYVNPILLNEASGELLAGHGRIDALAERKARGEPPPDGVRVLDGEWLTPVVRGVSLPSEEAEAYAIADNRTVELGGWDDEALAEVLRGLADAPGGLDGVGFGEADLEALLASIAAAQPDTREDHPEVISRADELQAKWQVRRGDVWLCGKHRIMCGDSMDADDVAKLMRGEKAVMTFADPPYNALKSWGKDETKSETRLDPSVWFPNDNLEWPEYECFLRASFKSICGHTAYVCCDYRVYGYMVSALETVGYDLKHCIVWVKNVWGLGWRYRFQHEFIVYACHEDAPFYGDRSQSDVWEVDVDRSGIHNTMKPVALCEKAIENSSRAGEIILDPFLGSGTTLIAAEKLGRICYGCEIVEAYCAVTLQRYFDFTGNMPRLADGR